MNKDWVGNTVIRQRLGTETQNWAKIEHEIPEILKNQNCSSELQPEINTALHKKIHVTSGTGAWFLDKIIKLVLGSHS